MARPYSREEYIAEMKPFWDNAPKDIKYTHKPTISVLSDSLVQVVDDFTMTTGKQKLSGRNTSLLVRKDGQWKWKVMVEPGWGEASQQGVGGSAPSTTMDAGTGTRK